MKKITRVRIAGKVNDGNRKVAGKVIPSPAPYRSADFYHSSRWTRLSRAFRESHPVCERCRLNGIIVPATVVDHIIPAELCSDPFDITNLQALCEKCNLSKAAEDKRMIQQWKGKQQRG